MATMTLDEAAELVNAGSVDERAAKEEARAAMLARLGTRAPSWVIQPLIETWHAAVAAYVARMREIAAEVAPQLDGWAVLHRAELLLRAAA